MSVDSAELVTHPAIMLALILWLDLLFGDPVYQLHPVRLIGILLSWYESRLRSIGLDGKFGGIILVLLLLFSALVLSMGISSYLKSLHWSLSWFWSMYLGWSFLALRDLLIHANHVAKALETENLPEDFYDVYLVDKADKITGIVPLGRLMSSKRDVILNKIQNKKTRTIKALTDQEEVAYQFTKYAMVSAPVIDEQDSIIGSITVDDVVEVIEEEREEDILKLGGVGQTDIFEDLINTIKSRFSWLLVNLLTAVAASIVIVFFQASIEKVVALAVLMPIVASMGGNAGTQTMTVAVRALATKELTPTNTIKIIIKETFVGGINGIIFALIVGILSAYWFNDNLLGIIIASAMIINLVIAGLVGTLIPISLNKINIDPALASGVILTTITDVFGFLSFLGLATIFLI